MQSFNYNESKQRGTKDFPIDYHYVDETHPQYVMPFHWHVDYEFMRIISGQFKLFLDGIEYDLSDGDLCFIPAGVLHGGTPNDCIYECIVFDINFLRNREFHYDQFLHKITHSKLSLQMVYTKNNAIPSELFSYVELLFDALREKNNGYELCCVGACYLLLSIIQKEQYYTIESDQPKKVHKKTDQLKSVLEFIEKSYATSITLEALSNQVNMSPKYFCRFFHTLTHRTPFDYLNNYRIERACHEIATSNVTLLEIGYSCGFNDFSYFIKTFKKYKGITPRQYALIELDT